MTDLLYLLLPLSQLGGGLIEAGLGTGQLLLQLRNPLAGMLQSLLQRFHIIRGNALTLKQRCINNLVTSPLPKERLRGYQCGLIHTTLFTINHSATGWILGTSELIFLYSSETTN